jgi:hypothetical protein
MRSTFAIGCAVLLAATLAACGGTSVPPVPACPTTVPPPAGSGPAQASRAYSTSVRSLADALKALRDREKASFPDRSFSGSGDFRPQFISFADSSVCTATALRALTPPQGTNATLDTTIDAAVDAYIQHTRAGRQAVATRNVSDFHKWYDAADAKLQAVTDAAAQITTGRRPFGP